jgi:hypothetical protein
MRMRMSTLDVGMRLGDAIDPFQLANGFEAVIGYECQERSNPPLPASFFQSFPKFQKKMPGRTEVGIPPRHQEFVADRPL